MKKTAAGNGKKKEEKKSRIIFQLPCEHWQVIYLLYFAISNLWQDLCYLLLQYHTQ